MKIKTLLMMMLIFNTASIFGQVLISNESLEKQKTKEEINRGLLITNDVYVLPAHWVKAGDRPDSYGMGIDKGAGRDGKNAATIKSIDKVIDGFGTLMQNCLPDKYLGKRVRLSGYIKTKDVVLWAGFWFRVDQADSNDRLGFDNMHDGGKDRSVKGTTDWTKFEIVLDVPLNASNLAYGALLNGTGQMWVDNISFEIVDKSVPVTGFSYESLINKEPVNLDFEK